MPEHAQEPTQESAPSAQLTMLIAFDGSPEAEQAMRQAARLLKPTHVEILTVWEPAHRTAARTVGISGLHQAEWSAAPAEEDPACAAANAVCHRGLELAESLHLIPRAHSLEAEASVWSAIVAAAEELKVDVIVTGTRGESGWRNLWQPSTAGAVLGNADVPVFIVPSAS